MSYIAKFCVAKYLCKVFALKLVCGEGSSTKVISSENSWMYNTCVYVLLDLLTAGVGLDYCSLDSFIKFISKIFILFMNAC